MANFRFVRAAVALMMLCAVSSCSSSSSDGGSSSAPSVTKAIGPAGGTIEVGGAIVTFPKDAVAAEMQITIGVVNEGPPAGYVALSKMFKCEPSGTNFLAPVEMRMPFTGGPSATLLWSTGADPTFKDLGGRVEGTTIVTNIRHFSRGIVVRKE